MGNNAGSIRVTVDDRVLQSIIHNSPDHLDTFLRKVAMELVTDIKLSFGTSPSSPGQPPGVDTGALRAGIRQEKQRALVYWIMDGVLYGVYLEDGTERMAARPFMRPAFERLNANFGQVARDYGMVKL